MKSTFLCVTTCIGLMVAALPANGADDEAPGWLKDLSFEQPPVLELFPDGSRMKGSAHIVVRNSGPNVAPAIRIRCTVYDQAGNAVDQLSGSIGRIRPGKLGITQANNFTTSPLSKEADCEILPSS